MSLTKIVKQRDQSFRAYFAVHWAEYLQANYRNPEEVVVNFGVRYQTALNWWQGTNSPSGYAVALAFQQNPEGAQAHFARRAA